MPKLSKHSVLFIVILFDDYHTDEVATYLIFVIFFTQAKILENKIYTEKTRKLPQNTQ